MYAARTLVVDMRPLTHDSHICTTSRMTSELPLPPDPTRPKIDFVVLMVDLSNLLSLQALHAAIAQLHPFYYLGRSMIIATHGMPAIHPSMHRLIQRCSTVITYLTLASTRTRYSRLADKPHHYAFTLGELDELTETYEIPVLVTNLCVCILNTCSLSLSLSLSLVVICVLLSTHNLVPSLFVACINQDVRQQQNAAQKIAHAARLASNHCIGLTPSLSRTPLTSMIAQTRVQPKAVATTSTSLSPQK